MPTSWLSVGRRLQDPEGVEWRVLSVGPTRVELGNPDLGRHELLREDLIAWVDDGAWSWA